MLVDEGFNRFPGQATFFDALKQDVAAFVAPAELGDESGSRCGTLRPSRGAMRVRPFLNRLVGIAAHRTLADLSVGDTEKPTAPPVER
jgi:hypothetical protein